MFVAIEGIDGVGKTTQVAKLKQFLLSQNINCISTKEPGGQNSKIGMTVREMIVNDNSIDQETKLLLIYAARRHHVLETMLPALESDKWVICDRFYLSTISYLSYTNENINFNNLKRDAAFQANLNKVAALHKSFAKSIMPDVTIYIKATPEESNKRISMREEEANSYDLAGIQQKQNLCDTFDYLMESEAKRNNAGSYIVINGMQSADKVQEDIRLALSSIIESFKNKAQSTKGWYANSIFGRALLA